MHSSLLAPGGHFDQLKFNTIPSFFPSSSVPSPFVRGHSFEIGMRMPRLLALQGPQPVNLNSDSFSHVLLTASCTQRRCVAFAAVAFSQQTVQVLSGQIPLSKVLRPCVTCPVFCACDKVVVDVMMETSKIILCNPSFRFLLLKLANEVVVCFFISISF